MIKMWFRNQAAKEGKESWWLNQDKLSLFFLYLLILFLPTQIGKHFFPNFSFVFGLISDYLSPTLYLTDILIFFIFLFSFKNILTKALNSHKTQFFYFLLIALSLIIGISVSKNPLAGYYGLLKLLEFIYLGVYVFFNFIKINKHLIVYALITGIIFESTLAVFQYINQGSFQGMLYFLGERSFNAQTPGIANASINGKLILRPYATFSHPNVLAGYLELAVIWILSLKTKINKYFLLIVTSLAILGILISLSRTAIIALSLSVFIYFVLSLFEKYKKGKFNSSFLKPKILWIFIIVFFLITIIFNPFFIQRFTQLRFSDETITQREQLINTASNMIIKNPIFGVGLNNFLNNLSEKFDAPPLLQPVHNIFLLSFAQGGIIGFLIIIYLFTKAILNQFVKREINIYKLCIIFSIIVIGFFDHYFLTIQQGQILFTLLLSYCLSKTD